MKRIQLPDPVREGSADPQALRRIVAELTTTLNRMTQEIATLRRLTDVAADTSMPPLFKGQIAVDSGDVYVSVGLDVVDWTLVS